MKIEKINEEIKKLTQEIQQHFLEIGRIQYDCWNAFDQIGKKTREKIIKINKLNKKLPKGEDVKKEM